VRYTHLSLRHDGRCLAPEGLWNGARLTLVDCTHPLARLLQTSDARIVTQARTDLCLDVRDGRGGWDGRLQLWECGSDNPHQQFRWDGALHWRHWCVGTVWDGALVAATVGCADPSARWDAVLDTGYWG
jgi:hypothetical protein